MHPPTTRIGVTLLSTRDLSNIPTSHRPPSTVQCPETNQDKPVPGVAKGTEMYDEVRKRIEDKKLEHDKEVARNLRSQQAIDRKVREELHPLDKRQ